MTLSESWIQPVHSATAHKVITPHSLFHEVNQNFKTKEEIESSSIFFKDGISDENKINSYSIKYLTITFIDTLNFILDPDMVWKLVDENNNMTMNGKGSISQLIISTPGKYVIDLIQPKKFGGIFSSDLMNHDTCNHSPFPDKIEIVVSPIYLKFDFASIRFSQSLSSIHLKDVKLDIEAWFDHYEESDFVLPPLRISSAGVEAEVDGTLVQQTESLKKGKINLTYHLNGSFKKGSYIMLDFHDINNLIQSYSHLTMIN